MSRIRDAVYAIALFSLAGPAARADLQFQFSGVTNFAQEFTDIPVGTPFSGTFSYDPGAAFIEGSTNSAVYDTGLMGASFPGLELTPIPGGFVQVVTADQATPSDFLDIDSAFAINGDPSLTPYDLSIFIYFPAGTFSSLELPTTLPLADNLGAQLTVIAVDQQFFCCSGDASVAEGSIQAGDIEPVPEPTTVLLLASAIAAIGVRLKRS